MTARCALLACLLAPLLTAQAPRWSLPADRSLEYTREHRVSARALEPAAKPGDAEPHSYGVPAPFGGGVLLASDLDPKGRGMARGPFDLTEVIPWLGFDLGTFRAGKSRIEYDLVKPFGRLRIETDGAAPRPTTEASLSEQTIRFRLRREPLDDGSVGGPARDRKQRFEDLARSYDHELEGTLELVRTFDGASGRIRELTARLDATITLPPGREWRKVGITIDERWELRSESVADSAAFRERVGASIERGREHLLEKLREHLARLTAPPEPLHVDNAAGEIALLALTVIKAGASRDDPALLEALAMLRTRRLRDTYTLGVALMAFEAFWADPNERQHLIEGLIPAPRVRTPDPADKERMAEWVARLLDNRDRSASSARSGRWTYTGGDAFDNSNTQYALLGLWSAHLCDVRVPVDVWVGAARHWLAVQCPSEGSSSLSLLTHRQLAQGKARATTTGAELRGWSYGPPHDAPYGSMTAAGTASLLVIQAAIRDLGGTGADVMGDVGRAIRSGYAWLARHLDVRSNPGRPRDHDYWRVYWLHGLERACELGQIARLGERDWYFEGASVLLAMQTPAGSFHPGGTIDDCFAILFLKKAQVPVSTGGR